MSVSQNFVALIDEKSFENDSFLFTAMQCFKKIQALKKIYIRFPYHNNIFFFQKKTNVQNVVHHDIPDGGQLHGEHSTTGESCSKLPATIPRIPASEVSKF